MQLTDCERQRAEAHNVCVLDAHSRAIASLIVSPARRNQGERSERQRASRFCFCHRRRRMPSGRNRKPNPKWGGLIGWVGEGCIPHISPTNFTEVI